MCFLSPLSLSHLTVALDTLLVMSYVCFFGKVRRLCVPGIFHFFTFLEKYDNNKLNNISSIKA